MSPYEVTAREQKATRITDHVWSCFLFACGDTNPTHAQVSALVTELAASGEAVRAAFARGAGVKPPSSRTWLRVIELASRRGMRVCREAVQAQDPWLRLAEGNADVATLEAVQAELDAVV